MPVTILDAWTGTGDFPTDGLSLASSAGSNRAGWVFCSHEMNGGGGMSMGTVTWGDQTVTEVHDFVVGSTTAYHNLNYVGYITEAQIAAMSGSALSFTFTNGNGGVGPFGNAKAYAATYQDVDQADIVSDSNSAVNTSTASLAPGAVDIDVDQRAISFVVAGQPNATAPGTGYTEELAFTGPSNDHASGAMQRTATTNDDTHNVAHTCSASTRMAVSVVVMGAAVTAYTIDAAAGSYAWTGTVANLEYHSAVDAASGSYAWTGTAANLEYHSAVDAESGSYAWTGQAASLEYHSAVDAESGTYSWTGTAANLEYHSVIDAESGSYSWSGQDASLLLSFIMAADTTSYAWTGNEVTFLQDLVLPVDSGSYAWTGTAANLEYHSVLGAESASYAWTGTAASLVQGFSVDAESASYAWTGQTATLVFDALVNAESGAYTWTGQDATLTYVQQNTLVAGSGSYLWTGNAVTFLSDLVMEADAGSYLWTGSPVTLTYTIPSLGSPPTAMSVGALMRIGI